jgi:hypothetical protein
MFNPGDRVKVVKDHWPWDVGQELILKSKTYRPGEMYWFVEWNNTFSIPERNIVLIPRKTPEDWL